jgi:hypothetical protein
MYARFVRSNDTQYKGIEFLVYMTRDDIPGSAVTRVINLVTGSEEITSAKSTASGLTVMITYTDLTPHAITLTLDHLEVVRALRLTNDNKVTNKNNSSFKLSVQYDVAPKADGRAISIAGAWNQHTVPVQTAEAAQVTVSLDKPAGVGPSQQAGVGPSQQAGVGPSQLPGGEHAFGRGMSRFV